jgi:hypothetical protein
LPRRSAAPTTGAFAAVPSGYRNAPPIANRCSVDLSFVPSFGFFELRLTTRSNISVPPRWRRMSLRLWPTESGYTVASMYAPGTGTLCL